MRFKCKTQVKNHIEDKHQPELEFNCNQYSFQGDSEVLLKNHMNLAHNKMTADKSLSCHNCGENFASKPALMDHRKEKHPEIIRKCRYFLQGNCAFEDGCCWYRHEDRETQDSDATTFKCSFCEKNFTSMSTLMVHKKETHSQPASLDVETL